MPYWAWSDLMGGGKTKTMKLADGREREIVEERNVTPRGSKVTKAKLGVSDEEWDALIEGGSIRNYDLPEGADEFTSPTQAMLRSLVNNRGDIDLDKVMELGLANPPAINPPAEEEAELPAGA